MRGRAAAELEARHLARHDPLTGLPKVASPEVPAQLARRIIGAVEEPFALAGGGATLSVGVGIAIAPDDGVEPDELVRRADLALYRAKVHGRSTIRFFEPGMNAHVERRLRIEHELRAAIAVEAIVPHYQPIVSLDGNRIIGFEALTRWLQHEDFPLTFSLPSPRRAV